MRRHRIAWQLTWEVTVAIVGLAIVALVLIGPRARATMVAGPAASEVNVPAQRVNTAQSGTTSTGTPPSDPAAGQAPAANPTNPDPGSQPGVSASGGAGGSAGASTGPRPVGGAVGRTLFSDDFTSDPLGQAAVPAGWHLADTPPVTGGLPIVGSLLGIGSSQSSLASLLPTTILDGVTPVLTRSPGAWSHLTAGSSAWGDYSVTATVKPMSAEPGYVGVAGRFQNLSNFLSCGIQNGSGLALFEVINGQQRTLASQRLSIAPNVFHTIRMTMNGGQVTCSMDGMSLMHGTVTGGLSSGQLSLVALGDLASEFDNVAATTLP